MALPMVPIYTQTVGAGGASAITFNNIPQFYTDLMIEISGRENVSGQSWVALYLRYNNDSSSLYSDTRLFGNGSSASSSRLSATANFLGSDPSTNTTANTFNNISVYMPNYAGSNYKQIITDAVGENNATGTEMYLNAGLYRSTNPITRIDVLPQISFVQYSTVSLYGIIRYGA